MNEKYFVLFLFAFIYSSEACDCFNESSLKIYCSAKWVANFKVLDVKRLNYAVFEYSIDYIQVFKMPSIFYETYPTKIYSYASDSMCGMELKKDRTYLIPGSVTNSLKYRYGLENVIKVNHCDLLDNEFKHMLKSGDIEKDACEKKTKDCESRMTINDWFAEFKANRDNPLQILYS